MIDNIVNSGVMCSLGVRRRRWSARRCLGAALLVAGALVAARLALPAPPALLSSVVFPGAKPATVAHLLADFSTHPSPFSIPISWSLEKESSNYTSWRYSVSYSCGARCAGAAHVAAHDEGAPRHGPAPAHRVVVHNTFCVTLPLLPWPHFCGETETTSLVVADAHTGGARVEERAVTRCDVVTAFVLGPRCAARDLRELRDRHLQYVRRALRHDNPGRSK